MGNYYFLSLTHRLQRHHTGKPGGNLGKKGFSGFSKFQNVILLTVISAENAVISAENTVISA